MSVIVNPGAGAEDEEDEDGSGPLHTTLASALLELRVTSQEVNDVLWTNTMHRTPITCGSPTAENAIGIAMKVSGYTATSLGLSIKHTDALGKTIRTRRLDDLWQGVVQNPYLRLEDGEWMLEQDPSNAIKEAVQERILARKVLNLHISAGVGDVTLIVNELLKARDGDLLVMSYLHSEEMRDAYRARLVGTSDLALRESFLDMLQRADQDQYDKLCAYLLEHAEEVDVVLLQWLKDSETLDAELMRALTFPENGVQDSQFGRSLARRLDERTAWWALELGEMLDLAKESRTPARQVAMWRTYEAPRVSDHARKEKAKRADAQRSQIMALRMTGLSDESIAPIILGGAEGLPHDELLEVLAGGGSTLVAEYLAGMRGRLPQQGDATYLWDKLNADRREYACAALAEHTGLGEQPWTADLVMVAPKVLTRGFPSALVWAAYRMLHEKLGNDADAWEVAVALVNEWSGTMEELVYTCRTLVPEGGRANTRFANTTADVSRILFGKSEAQIEADEKAEA